MRYPLIALPLGLEPRTL